MKYVILSIVAIAAVFGLSFLIAGLIRRKLKRKPPMWGHILISIGSGAAALGVAFLIFANIHYPADAEAKKVRTILTLECTRQNLPRWADLRSA